AVSAVWMFPLEAFAQNGPATGVGGGVPGEVAEGVAGGIAGGLARGVAGGVEIRQTAGVPEVDRSDLWIDTGKGGAATGDVRGLGELARSDASGKLVARIALPEAMTRDVRADQIAMVDTRKGVVQGHVGKVGEVAVGVRNVDIALDGPLPDTAVAGLA